MAEKPLAWVGSSLDDLRGFPVEARQEAGYQLWRAQTGLLPTDAKPLATVGAGVTEIRIHTGQEHRVLYIAKYEEAVYVLHAFEKRTRKTAQADLDLARERVGLVLAHRRRRKEKGK